MEKEMQLIFLSETSIYLVSVSFYILMISLRFKTKVCFEFFSSIAFETVQSQTEENQKIFSISNFSNFWKYRNKFQYQLKKNVYDELPIISE